MYRSEAPVPGSNSSIQSPSQQSILGRNTDFQNKLTQDWADNKAKINSDPNLCHDPEGGAGDQSFVGDDGELTQVDQPTLQGGGYGLRTVGHSEFAENVVDVTLNRRLANPQAGGYFLVALALHDQFQHFHLTAG